MSASSTGLSSVYEQVQTTMLRALTVVRLVVAAYAVTLNAVRWHEFERPVLGWLVVALVVVWTAVASVAYERPGLRRLPLLVADLAVAVVAMLSTPLVQSPTMLDRNASTIPSFWVVAAVLAWAVLRGWPGGTLAALVVSAVDLSVRASPTGTTWGNIFLLVLAAGGVGYSTRLVQEATEARAAAERTAAALAERARLARAVHDGVLQVLALVQRRGAELGGDAADLGRLAGDQEVALRSLVQHDATVVPRAGAGLDGSAHTAPLVATLVTAQSAQVAVSGPGTEVVLPAAVVSELAAAVHACLDNVRRHVGPDARAWVLVEDLGATVVVTVRDEGPGLDESRIAEAGAEGRLGVRESICGRLAELGGQATLVSSPGTGTEWELSVPRAAARR